jgi:hypothetical protein
MKLISFLSYDKYELKSMLTKKTIRYIPIINKLNITLSDEIKKYISDEKDAIKK